MKKSNCELTSYPALSYKDAGVDIHAGNDLVQRIKPLAKKTRRPGSMGGIGGFGALFEIPKNYKNPVLVSGTDGVGTKLKLAMDQHQHDGIGIDLVAMCANDLIVCGAEPLFFLDYYATGQLDVALAERVIASIAEGCLLSGCALAGGETAEMPGMYQGHDYDLAGFCVGVVEKQAIITGEQVKEGDALIGLASSGPHSNGYSLIRKIIAQNKLILSEEMKSALLMPTRIYVKPLLQLMKAYPLHALAHITGGGLVENIPRVLPDHLGVEINLGSWELPTVFTWLQQQGALSNLELYRTFNCGVGMVLCVDSSQKNTVIKRLHSLGEKAWCLGKVTSYNANDRLDRVIFID